MRYAKVVSIKRETREARLHNLAVSKHENFFANGVCVHNCRCALEVIVGDDVPENFVAGVPPGASFTPGFGTRADLRTYGA